MKKVVFLTLSLSLLVLCNCSKQKNFPKPEKSAKVTTDPSKTDTLEISEKSNRLDTAAQNTKKETLIPKKNVVTEKTAPKTAASIPSKKITPIEKKTIIVEEKNTVKLKEKIDTITKSIDPIVVIKPKHDLWDTLTKKYVSVSGKVNYTAFKNNIAQVEKYLLELENTPPKKEWSKAEKLAYWFNLYNAATVYLVASNYPVKSIKEINNGKPWDKKFIKSGNQLYSLNEIENSIVRPHFNEPRLHVAFNCAAISCPNLQNEAFVASKLDNQLNVLSKKWINDPSKNNISSDSDIQISKIFDWYAIDFKQGIIPFINRFSNAKINEKATISYLEYNWDLND